MEEREEISKWPEAGEYCEVLSSRYARDVSPGTHTSFVYQHKGCISRSHQHSFMDEEGTHDATPLAEELAKS